MFDLKSKISFDHNLLATTSSIALVCFEHAITFEYECLIWRQKWRGAAWLFVLNRYALLASVLVPNTIPFTSRLCTNLVYESFLAFITGLPLVIAAFFSALRVFALLNHGYLTAIFVFLLAVVGFNIGLYNAAHATYVFAEDPVLESATCFTTESLSMTTHRIESLAHNLSGMLSNFIVILVTWKKTYHQTKRSIDLGIASDFSALLLRDGSIYFGVILLMDLLRLLMDNVHGLGILRPVFPFLNILPSIVISRFLVNLCQLEFHDGFSSTVHNTTIGRSTDGVSTMHFSTFVAERVLDESLDHTIHSTWSDADGSAETEVDFIQYDDVLV